MELDWKPWGKEVILDLVCGDENAALLIRGFLNLCEVWDDAIDRDHAGSDASINGAFEWALFELNANPFYVAHPELSSAMRVCIANWKTANYLENSKYLEHLHTAYTLRCSPYDFFVAVALAAGGQEAADRAAFAFRGRLTGDSLDAYIKEHTQGDHHGMVK